MADLKYVPVVHDHKVFLSKARAREGFSEAYGALELEYQVANQMLRARSRAGLTQDAVAEKMGTSKNAISRLESAAKHTPDSQHSSGMRRRWGAICKSSWCLRKLRSAVQSRNYRLPFVEARAPSLHHQQAVQHPLVVVRQRDGRRAIAASRCLSIRTANLRLVAYFPCRMGARGAVGVLPAKGSLDDQQRLDLGPDMHHDIRADHGFPLRLAHFPVERFDLVG